MEDSGFQPNFLRLIAFFFLSTDKKGEKSVPFFIDRSLFRFDFQVRSSNARR